MAPQKKPSTAVKCNIKTWYKADDEQVHFLRKKKAAVKTVLRKNIQAGQVLILLAGKYRGKRVVFLKQLQSGLLLVTGPHRVNGVPLKRVNQAYVIPTKTQVSLASVNFEKIDDKFFEKIKAKAVKKSQANFFQSGKSEVIIQIKFQLIKLTETQKQQLEVRNKAKYAEQVSVDKSLIANIKKVDLLKKYLSSRFSLTKNQRPHEMTF